MEQTRDRGAEWFVPRFGPRRFRIAVGLLFLPYTGMVLSFAVFGSILAADLYRGRLVATLVVYFLGLGIAAHALDAVGSRETKPWGDAFTKRQLWFLILGSLGLAYGIAVYYILLYVPLISIFAVLEGFFVFAYNLEWFRGRFHTDGWFAFSWGFLPVLAGYCMQTNRIHIPALFVGGAAALFSLIEIKSSRPYKELKRSFRSLTAEEEASMKRYETLLKSVSLGVCLLAVGLLLARAAA